MKQTWLDWAANKAHLYGHRFTMHRWGVSTGVMIGGLLVWLVFGLSMFLHIGGGMTFAVWALEPYMEADELDG